MSLTFTTLWANSADDKLIIFLSYFSQKTGFDSSRKLSPKETIFAGKVKPYFLKKKKKKKKKKKSTIFQNIGRWNLTKQAKR